MLTNQWLRNCIYNPLATFGKQGPAMASLITWAASALWHGFQPSYYLTFLSGAMVTATGITLRRNLRPLFTGRSTLRGMKPVYDALGWVLTQGSLNYICAPFPLYALDLGLRVWSSVYFVVHVGMILILVAFGVKALGIRGLVRSLGRGVGAEFEKAGDKGVSKKASVGASLKNGVKENGKEKSQ
ncbi:lysophospholipid acyltransferase [Phlyctochytrium planicorne]|nr:lysophospholipid acyltransferase [Phlyctochytrium planicorne]